jgi:hypothetical protein
MNAEAQKTEKTEAPKGQTCKECGKPAPVAIGGKCVRCHHGLEKDEWCGWD